MNLIPSVTSLTPPLHTLDTSTIPFHPLTTSPFSHHPHLPLLSLHSLPTSISPFPLSISLFKGGQASSSTVAKDEPAPSRSSTSVLSVDDSTQEEVSPSFPFYCPPPHTIALLPCIALFPTLLSSFSLYCPMTHYNTPIHTLSYAF